jgi:hypothetical protein
MRYLEQEKVIAFTSPVEFDDWYIQHQSLNIDFGFAEVTDETALFYEVETRAATVIEYIEQEIKEIGRKNYGR